MVISVYELEKIIKESFPDAYVEISDFVGDSDHFRLKISSKCFLGRTRVEQHKMVYKALEGLSIHALQLETST
ncbi:MAG: BolA/IbaG family iron-sulfur metabolism protein [Wolbachia endosymbiont of Meromenopon meropis]|nr:BolA/IbaG family iron-sulfur metabolism protein [Wolbachia endosymbiont of Meromenopon meropis]